MLLTRCNPEIDVAFAYCDLIACDKCNDAVIKPLGDDADADQLDLGAELFSVAVDNQILSGGE